MDFTYSLFFRNNVENRGRNENVLLSLLSHTHAFNNDPHASITRLREIQSDAGCIKTGANVDVSFNLYLYLETGASVGKQGTEKGRWWSSSIVAESFLIFFSPSSYRRVFNFAPLRRTWMQIEMSCDDCVDDCPQVMTLSLSAYRTFIRLQESYETLYVLSEWMKRTSCLLWNLKNLSSWKNWLDGRRKIKN